MHQREHIIRYALQGDGSTTARVETAAKTLALSARSVRRLIARYAASAETTSIIAHPLGPKKSYRRLDPELERIMHVHAELRRPAGARSTRD
jgi:hypothetical protein